MGVARSNKLRERAKIKDKEISGDKNLAVAARSVLGWYSSDESDFVTVSEAAERADLSHRTVTRLIDGDTAIKGTTMQRFAQALGADPTPLLRAAGYIQDVESERMASPEIPNDLAAAIQSGAYRRIIVQLKGDGIQKYRAIGIPQCRWRTGIDPLTIPVVANVDPDGSVTVVSYAGNYRRLLGWAMTFGHDIRVIEPNDLRDQLDNVLDEIDTRWERIDRIEDVGRFRLHDRLPDCKEDAITNGIDHWTRILEVSAAEKDETGESVTANNKPDNAVDYFRKLGRENERKWRHAKDRYVRWFNLKDPSVQAMDLRLQAQLYDLCITYDIIEKGGMPGDEAEADIVMGRALTLMELKDKVIEWDQALRSLEINEPGKEDLHVILIPLRNWDEFYLNLFDMPMWLRWATGDIKLEFEVPRVNYIQQTGRASSSHGKPLKILHLSDIRVDQNVGSFSLSTDLTKLIEDTDVVTVVNSGDLGKTQVVAELVSSYIKEKGRLFIINTSQEVIGSPDLWPDASLDDVKEMFSIAYPELSGAIVKQIEAVSDGQELYTLGQT